MERWREREDGLLELVDDQGKVLAVEKRRRTIVRQLKRPDGSVIPSIQRNPGLAKKSNHGKRIMKDPVTGQEVWVPQEWGKSGKRYPFHQGTWDRILELLLEKEITEICRMEDMPPYKAVLAWRRDPEKQAEYDDACRGRAEFHRAKAVEIANQTRIDADDAAGERLKADIRKWAAETDDREKFGKQTKLTGNGGQPLVLIVNTGVPQPTLTDVNAESVVTLPTAGPPADPRDPEPAA